VARRPVAVVAAVVLIVEAVGFALLNWFLGTVVDRQHMSIGGLDPRVMTVSTWSLGLIIAGFLLLCAAALLRAGLRNTGPAGFWRALLISAAVLHGVLGAFSVGLVGWAAFGFMMVVLGLIVLSLIAYDEHGDDRPWWPGWLRRPGWAKWPGGPGRPHSGDGATPTAG
jgi:energy-coupling factor transporter transmembrane protein EcfT